MKQRWLSKPSKLPGPTGLARFESTGFALDRNELESARRGRHGSKIARRVSTSGSAHFIRRFAPRKIKPSTSLGPCGIRTSTSWDTHVAGFITTVESRLAARFRRGEETGQGGGNRQRPGPAGPERRLAQDWAGGRGSDLVRHGFSPSRTA